MSACSLSLSESFSSDSHPSRVRCTVTPSNAWARCSARRRMNTTTQTAMNWEHKKHTHAGGSMSAGSIVPRLARLLCPHAAHRYPNATHATLCARTHLRLITHKNNERVPRNAYNSYNSNGKKKPDRLHARTLTWMSIKMENATKMPLLLCCTSCVAQDSTSQALKYVFILRLACPFTEGKRDRAMQGVHALTAQQKAHALRGRCTSEAHCTPSKHSRVCVCDVVEYLILINYIIKYTILVSASRNLARCKT